MYLLGAHIQTALISAIYRKSLQLNNQALRHTTTGEIVNLMSVDAQRFVDLMPYINLLWSAPLRIILLIYFIYRELGPSVFAGVAVMIILIPINWYFTAYQRRLQLKQMIKKDERVKVIGEMLSGMRVIKLYGWEVPFIRKISTIRDMEIVQLREISYINTISSFLWTCAPFLVSFFTFMVYVLSSDQNVLDPKKAFVSLSLFSLMNFPLSMLPRTIANVVMMFISIRRLNRFLSSPQLENYVTRIVVDDKDGDIDAISIINGTFSWEPLEPSIDDSSVASANNSNNDNSLADISDATINTVMKNINNNQKKKQYNNKTISTINRSLTLHGINLNIKKGSLIAVVGQVGSGKSSLLSAILGDMERIEGEVYIDASCTLAYVSQQAWIRNATLKENILFGNPYIQYRYEAIIEMCALKPDISILPGGDETEIGEKGINLSGGQKQRVAIARACYSDASIVLFDDPLSAVDSHVARHIFNHVIANRYGYLKNKTRVLVTNSIFFLSEMDMIIVLSDGNIAEIGTYQELITSNTNFAHYIQNFSEDSKIIRRENHYTESNDQDIIIPLSQSKTNKIGSVINNDSTTITNADQQNRNSSISDIRKKLIKSEHTETGEVKASVYIYYFQSFTFFWLIMILFGYIGIQASAVGANVWLAIWSNDNNIGVSTIINNDNENIRMNSGELLLNNTIPFATNITQAEVVDRNYYLTIFGCFGLSQAIFVLFASIAKEKAIVGSSITLHRSLLESIMRSPLKFFDTTPLGRIVNRFAKDIDSVDHKIPQTVHTWLMTFLQVIFTLLLIVVQVPVFMVVVIPIIIIYYFVQVCLAKFIY